MSLTLTNLVHIYKTNKKPALQGLNLTINENFVIILGPSGTGKTTLLNILSTTTKSTSGNYFINDTEISDFSESQIQKLRKEKLGYLFQNYNNNLIEFMTLQSIIELLEKSHITSKLSSETIFKGLGQLNLTNKYLNIKINFLSEGEKQRVAIFLLLLKNPDILVLDEPTSALDQNNKNNVIKILHDLSKKGKKIIVATHDIEFLSYANKIVFIENGKLITNVFEKLIKQTQSSSKIIIFEGKILKDPKTKILLPDIFFDLIESKKFIFKFEKFDNSSILVKELSYDDFLSKKADDWIFVNDEKLDIPKNFEQYPWDSKDFFWQIIRGNLLIKFKD